MSCVIPGGPALVLPPVNEVNEEDLEGVLPIFRLYGKWDFVTGNDRHR
jgi:hypothetical protein